MYNNVTYNENDNIGTYNIWDEHTGLIDHRYSFNTANDSTNGTTGYKPVYIVGSIGNDGLFYLDSTKWWSQTLPSSADGKIYMYIGDAYDYYRLTFVYEHPMYVYTNGKLRQYAQDAATVTGHTVAKDVPSGADFNDTKNTAGSTDTSSKIFLVGTTGQAANQQSYSHDTAYVGTDGCLYSNSTKVSVEGHTHNYAASSHTHGAGDITSGSAAAITALNTGTFVNSVSTADQVIVTGTSVSNEVLSFTTVTKKVVTATPGTASAVTGAKTTVNVLKA
jgi:hypothetical protein